MLNFSGIENELSIYILCSVKEGAAFIEDGQAE